MAENCTNNCTNNCTIAQALQQAASLGLPRLDAQLLLLHALGQSSQNRAWLLAHDTETLTPPQQQHWQQLLQRRLAGEPVAYLLGQREFFGLPLAVNPHVLDPRPDTEPLVQWALDLLPTLPANPVLADMGTGSGAIACALAHHSLHHSQHNGIHASVYATDASPSALAVAQHNAQQLKLPITFAQGNWFAAFAALPTAPSSAPHATPRFHLIASNPPYIASNDPHLPALRHEPLSALVSGTDGLDDIRTLIAQAPHWLHDGGWLLLEHGYDQAAAVQALLQARGFTQVQGRKDLGGIVRCSGGQWLAGADSRQ